MNIRDNCIDFIIPWVDGSDPNWVREFNSYCPEDKRILDVGLERYRDNGLLKYWFRGVEKFAPWVRKVHFVTCGQKPEWLNVECPKLNFVKHSDYIPSEYLPVFSSHPIELMMHKIPDLAEQIVYFNDDLFLTAPVKKSFFFKDGLPRDAAVLNAISGGNLGHIVLNDLIQINKFFPKKLVLKKHLRKYFSFSYSMDFFRTLCLMPWKHFTGFLDYHFAQPYLKSALRDVWENCEEKLSDTMKNRFRSDNDVNQYLFRYWQLCKGQFYPTGLQKERKYMNIADPITVIIQNIISGKYREIVLNDAECEDYSERMQKIVEAFEKILPDKSSFEL